MDYKHGWALQQIYLARRLLYRRQQQQNPNNNNNCNERDVNIILCLEHSPVYTLGRGADPNHLILHSDDHENSEAEKARQLLSRSLRGPGTARLSLDSQQTAALHQLLLEKQQEQHQWNELVGPFLELMQVQPVFVPGTKIPMYRIERGGQVTFHGPGQLVVYPMLDLCQLTTTKPDLHQYLRNIEIVIQRVLNEFGIQSHLHHEYTGVWVGDEKIAAIGISSSRWITTHGFAINVNPDLSHFDPNIILPCGIEGKGVTSIAKVLRQQQSLSDATMPSMHQVLRVALNKMQEVFEMKNEIKLHPLNNNPSVLP